MALIRSGSNSILLSSPVFQLEQPPVSGAHLMFDEGFPNPGAEDREVHPLELIVQPDTSPHEVCQREL